MSLPELLAVAGMLVYAIGVFGFGAFMAAAPRRAVDAVVAYTRWPPMHVVEVVVCAFASLALLTGANLTRYPRALFALGALLAVVTIALLVLGRQWHAAYVAQATPRLQRWLRPAGVLSMLAAAWLVYAVIA